MQRPLCCDFKTYLDPLFVVVEKGLFNSVGVLFVGGGGIIFDSVTTKFLIFKRREKKWREKATTNPTKKQNKNSHTGTRTRVSWVRAMYPNHLDYMGLR